MQYLIPTWFVTPLQQGVAIVLILVVPTAIACLPLRWLRQILLLVAGLYVGAFLLLGVAGGGGSHMDTRRSFHSTNQQHGYQHKEMLLFTAS
jgi:hypothetical protein